MRGVAKALAHGHHAAHVPVVVSSKHDDDLVKATLSLVEVVGEVAGDVRRFTVTLDDYPVFVVTKVCRPKPDRAFLLVDVAQLAKSVDGVPDSPGLMQRLLVKVDV